MGRCNRCALLLVILFFFASVRIAHAQWIENGVPFYMGELHQIRPRATTDGAGGAIVTWNGDGLLMDTGYDIYAMKMFETDAITVPSTGHVLHQNHPNPFNPVTTIGFVLPRRCRVRLGVFDVSGAHVRTLVDRTLDAGAHTAVWDGRDDERREVASGVYFYRMTAGKEIFVKKCVLLR
jgi:hypothetical protein